MPLDRHKLIVEVAGAAALLQTFPPKVQTQIIEWVTEMLTDPDTIDGRSDVSTKIVQSTAKQSIKYDAKN